MQFPGFSWTCKSVVFSLFNPVMCYRPCVLDAPGRGMCCQRPCSRAHFLGTSAHVRASLGPVRPTSGRCQAFCLFLSWFPAVFVQVLV